MKHFKTLFALVFVFWAYGTYAQVTTDPSFPAADKPLTIFFDATGTGLDANTGDLYAHTGVTIAGQGDWKHVVGSWGNNSNQPKFTALGNKKYKLDIAPSINQFYSVASGEKVTKICMVIRSADGNSKNGPDIFISVYESTLTVKISQPQQRPVILMPNDTVRIITTSQLATSSKLFVDGQEVASTTSASISYKYTATTAGMHSIKATATDGTKSVADSMSIYVRGNIEIADIPNGMRDGINYIDDNTVGLVLFAPKKEFVFAIGDFSNWELDQKYLMKRTTDNQRYWIIINNLEKAKPYVFQYFVDGKLRIADPYTEQTCDPWNDEWIPATTYPNLVKYPKNKTEGIASVIQTGQEQYQWQVPNFNAPDKKNLIIYELHIRDFVKSRRIKDVMDTLNYLQKLGVNVVELMPINEFEGNDSWGYNPSFYFATDKAYGTPFDYKRFVDECHKRGIAVVIDMVLNHSFGQSPFLLLYANNGKPTADNPWYNQTCPHSNWCWGEDFNHESPATQRLVDSVTHFWIKQYKVDGFRFDFTKGFTNKVDANAWGPDQSRINILKRMADQIWKVNPKAYVILEHLAEGSEEKQLADYGMMMWGNMNHAYNEATMGWLDGSKDNLSGALHTTRGWSQPNLISYMESHDEERLMFKNKMYGNANGSYNIKDQRIGLRRVALAANFFIPLPGPKMIWQFGELGYDYSINTCPDGTVGNCRVDAKPIHWEYYTNDEPRLRLYQVFAALNKLKTSYPQVFSTTSFTTSLSTAQKRISLNHADMNVNILGNFALQNADVVPAFQHTGKWYEYYTGDSIDVTNVNAMINLAPGEYRLYTDKKLTKPVIVAGAAKDLSFVQRTVEVFPNPASQSIWVAMPRDSKQIKVYDLSGRNVLTNEVNEQEVVELDISTLRRGMYLLQVLHNNNMISNAKFVVE